MLITTSFFSLRKLAAILILIALSILMVYVLSIHKERIPARQDELFKEYQMFEDARNSKIQMKVNKKGQATLLDGRSSMVLPSVYDDDREIMSKWEPLSNIPHILHLSWKSTNVPEFAYSNIVLWKKFHPNWKIIFWNDEDVHHYVKAILKDNELFKFYETVPKKIMKMDFSRYVILYTIGGVYADIDVTPLRNLTPILHHHSCIIAREPEPFLNSLSVDGTVLASNFFMASRPGHPFMYFLMKKIAASKNRPETGPLGVSEALKEFIRVNPMSGRDGAVFLAPSLYFDPPHGSGDKIHMDMLNARCSNYESYKQSRSAFTNRLCEILVKEKRIDFEVMYKHPKFINASFVWHRMFGSWANPSAVNSVQYKSLSSLSFKLNHPTDVYDIIHVVNPYERERNVLKLQYDKN